MHLEPWACMAVHGSTVHGEGAKPQPERCLPRKHACCMPCMASPSLPRLTPALPHPCTGPLMIGLAVAAISIGVSFSVGAFASVNEVFDPSIVPVGVSASAKFMPAT